MTSIEHTSWILTTIISANEDDLHSCRNAVIAAALAERDRVKQTYRTAGMHFTSQYVSTVRMHMHYIISHKITKFCL